MSKVIFTVTRARPCDIEKGILEHTMTASSHLLLPGLFGERSLSCLSPAPSYPSVAHPAIIQSLQRKRPQGLEMQRPSTQLWVPGTHCIYTCFSNFCKIPSFGCCSAVRCPVDSGEMPTDVMELQNVLCLCNPIRALAIGFPLEFCKSLILKSVP